MLKVQGQQSAIAQLQRAMHAGRLGHTLLFAGPAGIGKFTLARELARTCLCDRPIEVKNQDSAARGGPISKLADDFPLTLACGLCDSCRAIDANSHPDLHIITKELIRYHDRAGKSKGTTLSIQVIRGEITGSTEENIEAKIYKRSFRGRGKWFLIDEAELMEIPAQNSLLKTLEEPPPESYLVLITTSPAELLSTIRSRSQIVPLKALPVSVIVPALIARGFSQKDARLLARLVGGSLGRAIAWADDLRRITEKNAAAEARNQRKAEKGTKESENDAPRFNPRGMLGWAEELCASLHGFFQGNVNGSQLAGSLQDLSAQYAQVQLLRDPLASKDRLTRDAIALFLGIAADWLTDAMRTAVGIPAEIPLPAGPAASFALALEPGLVRTLIAAARDAEAKIDQNAHVGLTLAALLAGWTQSLHVLHA